MQGTVTIVPAEGVTLTRILDASYALANAGLTREAFDRFHNAQSRTTWAAAHRQRVVAMERDEWVASAVTCRINAQLDQRAIRVCGIGAVIANPNVGAKDGAS